MPPLRIKGFFLLLLGGNHFDCNRGDLNKDEGNMNSEPEQSAGSMFYRLLKIVESAGQQCFILQRSLRFL